MYYYIRSTAFPLLLIMPPSATLDNNSIGNTNNQILKDYYAERLGDKLGLQARKLLVGYGRIPADQLESHVQKVVCSSAHTTIN